MTEETEKKPAEQELEAEQLEQGSDSLELTQNIMEDFLSRADVTAVYGEPVQHGETLVIPAAEVLAGMGFGIGGGGGTHEKTGKPADGSGGGGGGRTFARPVAVIVAGPNGVRVETVFDLTKVALALFTAVGFMVATSAKMRRGKIQE